MLSLIPSHWFRMARSGKVPVDFIPCGCGCGELIPSLTKRGKPAKFKYHHGFNLPINSGRKHTQEEIKKIGKSMRGENHWNYQGGKSKHSGGYVRLLTQTNKKDNRVLEHRYIWEQYHKACLLDWSNVHHINHKRDDNKIENLQAMMNYQHAILHRTGWRKKR